MIELGKLRTSSVKIAAISVMIAMILAAPMGAVNSSPRTFNFVGPTVTKRSEGLFPIVVPGVMNIQPGSYAVITGAGKFDPIARTANGGGAFTHYNYDGAVYCRGIWRIKEFVSYSSGSLVVSAEFIRENTPLSGYPKGSVGTLYLEITDSGWKLYGDPGISFPIFDVIESGQVPHMH